jgi:hypothetical protein
MLGNNEHLDFAQTTIKEIFKFPIDKQDVILEYFINCMLGVRANELEITNKSYLKLNEMSKLNK